MEPLRASTPDPAVLFLPLLVEGRAEDILGLFVDEPTIADPLEGASAGRGAAERLIASKDSLRNNFPPLCCLGRLNAATKTGS